MAIIKKRKTRKGKVDFDVEIRRVGGMRDTIGLFEGSPMRGIGSRILKLGYDNLWRKRVMMRQQLNYSRLFKTPSDTIKHD